MVHRIVKKTLMDIIGQLDNHYRHFLMKNRPMSLINADCKNFVTTLRS
jgi:hypothetical protein